MVVGARQSFQFFRQIAWFLGNNGAYKSIEFCITWLVLPNCKKPLHKSQFQVSHVSPQHHSTLEYSGISKQHKMKKRIVTVNIMLLNDV